MNLSAENARIIADLLDKAADTFSNHGCNDLEMPNNEHNRALFTEIERSMGDGDDCEPTGDVITFSDWALMRYFSEVLATNGDDAKDRRTAYLVAIIDGLTGQAHGLRIHSEPSPTMRMKYKPAVVMSLTRDTYEEAVSALEDILEAVSALEDILDDYMWPEWRAIGEDNEVEHSELKFWVIKLTVDDKTLWHGGGSVLSSPSRSPKLYMEEKRARGIASILRTGLWKSEVVCVELSEVDDDK